MGSCVFVLLFVASAFPAVFAQQVIHATIVVDGKATIAETDDNFICATLDWWPYNKCIYEQCPWGYSSVINMNLSRPLLAKAIQAFRHLRIRIGGSLQDRVVYDVGDLKSPCQPFRNMQDGLFGFSKGCLHMKRWDNLNRLFSKTGALVTFGLNALYGRQQIGNGVWGGAWDPSNARAFMNYTVTKGHIIVSWEFGNELSGRGIGASVSAELYGKDVINLKKIINDLYKNSAFKPSLAAPGGYFDKQWYANFLQLSGSGIVDIITHHIYNLGPGDDPSLVSKILDPNYLSSTISETFSSVEQTIQQNGPWSSAWVGEAGGAFNSGGRHVSNTFVDSFWYVDQLGMASRYNTKVYCRQTLVGGNYGLLDTRTLVPNPDYYSALLWDRLMGKGVLAVDTNNASPYLRAYAHCSNGRPGITLLLINLSNQTDFVISLQNSMTMELNGKQASDGELTREEYHLTPKNGYLQSQTVLLNGIPLELTKERDIPSLEPVHSNVKSPIYVSHLSIAFIVFPNFDAPSCAPSS